MKFRHVFNLIEFERCRFFRRRRIDGVERRGSFERQHPERFERRR